MRNHEISPDHANHPGWDADGCTARIVVSPSCGGVTSCGFACSATGGHCLPSDDCTSLAAQDAKQKAFEDAIKNAPWVHSAPPKTAKRRVAKPRLRQ